MAIVSDIEIRLMANIARLQQDMDQARQAVNSSMSSIRDAANSAGKALGALAVGFAAGAFAGWIKGAIDATDAVSDISQRTGVAIKDIAGLQMWFQKGGNEAGVFESTMVKLSKKIGEGGAEFEKLGIKTRDANGAIRSNVEVLMDSADAFAAMEDGTAKTALAVDLFGKSGAELIPLLNEGSDGLREMNDMAERLGLTFDEKTVDAAGDFNDTLDFMAAASQGVARQVAAQLLPSLNAVTESMFEFITAGNGVQNAAAVIGTGFKLIYTAGVLVTQAFNVLGKTAGMLAAQIASLFQLEFKQAMNIGHAWQADMKDVFTSTAKTIGDTWSGAGGTVVEALVKTTSAGTVAAGASDKAGKAAKQQADAYGNLIEAIQGKIFESEREAAGIAKLTDSQKLAMSLDKALTDGTLTLTAAREANYRALIEMLGASEEAARVNKEIEDSNKRAAKGAEDLAKFQKALADEADKAVETAVREAESQEELARTFGMTKTALAELALTRAQDNLERARAEGLDYDELQRLEKLVDARQRAATAIADIDDMERQRDLWKSIEETAHDTFISIADGGKDAATRLKDTFKNIFFDWLYQQTLKKWIINLQGNTSMSSGGGALSSLAGMFGGGGSTGGGGGSGIMGTASSLLSIGKTIYSGFSTGIAGSLGTMITQLGTTFGSTAVASFGAGMSGAAGATGAAASAGASAASAIPVIGWIIAGMNAANGFFKQGFDMQNGTVKDPLGLGSGIKTFDKLLRGIGLNDKMANIFSGQAVFAKLFGRANPVIEKQGIQGTVSAGGFSGQAFAEILEKGGWFRSDKRYTKASALDGATDSAFDKTITTMVMAVRGFGEAMGLQTDVINGYSKQIKLTLGKDEAENQKIIEAAFSGIADDLSNLLIPNLARFAAEGEIASTTLQRLATEFQSVNAVFDMLGVQAATAFGAVGIASLDARKRLLELAGGVDALASQTSFFAQNFLSTAEQIAPAQKALAEQMAALGYAGVDTADEFKAAVLKLATSGALATEAGAKQYAALLALAPTFKQVTDYTTELARAQAAAAEEARAAAEAEKALADERAAQSLRDYAAVALDVLRRSIEGDKEILAQNFNKLMERFGKSITAQQDKISKLTSLSNALGGASVGDVSDMQSQAQRVQGQSQILAALAIAKASGVLPTADSLQSALSSVSRDAADQFASFVDYQRDQLLTQNSIEELSGLTSGQLSTAERTLGVLEQQRDRAQLAYDAEIARLDSMVISAQLQLDAINGVNLTSMSIVAAFNAFQSTISAALGNKAIAAGPSAAEAQVEKLYQQVFGRNSDIGGLSYWSDMLRGGMSLDAIRNAFYTSTEYQDRYANVYTPQSSGTMSGSNAASVMENFNNRMASVENAMNQIATNTGQFAQQFNQVSGGGNALATESI